MRLRLVAAFDLCAWPLLSNLAAVIQGPLLRWARDEPLPETEYDDVG